MHKRSFFQELRKSLSSLSQSLYQRKDGEDVKSQRSVSVIISSSEESEESKGEEKDQTKGRGSQCCQWWKEDDLNASNLEFNPVDPGNWDNWGVYYCSSRYGRHKAFNPKYFALAVTIIIGQTNFINLIHLMHENGGCAFLVVLAIVYLTFGIPTYLLETLLGQYSGKKPIIMIRLMMPIFSGLGIAFYIRTFCRAMNALGCFTLSIYHFWDLLYCKSCYSALLKRLVLHHRDNRKFQLFQGLSHPLFSDVEEEFALDKLSLFATPIVLFISLYKLKNLGQAMTVILRLLFLFLTGYTFTAYSRIHPNSAQQKVTEDSIVYLPLKLTFTPEWLKLLDGRVWAKALTFVMSSMELGTLVHMYIGSKNFYHYRCVRDGFYLALVAIVWNLIGMLGVLLWLGYVGIDKKELEASFEELKGHYGLLVVFIMKHIQAEMTQEMETDVLLCCAWFFLITGLAAMFATVCYIYILSDSCFPESGHPMIKICTILWHVFVFGYIFFPAILSGGGLNHLIFLNYYGAESWTGTFLVLCFICGVVFTHGFARVMYDFYNICHLKGYEVKTLQHHIPKLVGVVYLVFPVATIIWQILGMRAIRQGPVDWSDITVMIFGNLLSLLPIFAVLFGVIFYWVKEKQNNQKVFQSHRDFYKNKHHICVCFREYQFFDMEADQPQISKRISTSRR